MSDENNSGETGENGPAPQPGVTHEDLQSFRNGLFADMRKMVEGIVSKSAPEPAPKAEKRNEGKTNKDELAELRQQIADRDYRDKVRDALGETQLSKGQRDLMTKLAMAERPDDVGEFIKAQLSNFSKPEANPEPIEQEPQVRKPPVSDGGTPKATSAGEAGDDILRWSGEDYQRQLHMKAENPANPYDIRNRKFHREIRLRAEAAMAKTRVKLGPQR